MTDTAGIGPHIAIVGMAGRFPAARTVDELWRLLTDVRAATTWLGDDELLAAGVSEDDLAQANYVKAAMVLPDMEMFDAGFFGFSPLEASILDPQHRHFLETCWEALEDAGHVPRRFPGAIGVFGGCGMQTYMAEHLLPNAKLRDSVGTFLLRHTGNDKDFLTTRVSYLLDLKGPSVGVQTACSTSLVSVHVACQSLLAGECDMALAGGVSIELPHRVGYLAADGEILSPTGHCAAFDDDAKGTVFGSGAAVVVLRRLEDALADGDCIRGVILGTAINNDGASKAGYLSPSVDGQAKAAAEAIAVAGVAPSSIDYIEAHGTGTVIGDPIELAALTEAYGAKLTRGSIGIGSIKTNIGHLDTAAGAASLIKVVLGLEHGSLPASLNYRKPNSRFAFDKSPFAVVGTTRPWPRGDRPRRAAVNSLGVGGTNAHAVIEEAPAAAGVPTSDSAPGGFELITLSAKTPAALDGLVAKWRQRLADADRPFALDHAAYTTQIGREAFPYRLAIAARTRDGLAEALAGRSQRRSVGGVAEATPPNIVFMFPGGGAQYPAAARGLYLSQPAFRQAADDCLALMPCGARDLAGLMFGPEAEGPGAAQRLEHPLCSILAVFTVSYAMARTWASLGVRPEAVIGHSAGDYAAAVSAGIMSLEDAIGLVALRGEIFAALPPGGMLAVELDEAELRCRAGLELDIAVLNGPCLGVVSGDIAAIERLKLRLDSEGVTNTRVRIGVAAHSRMLDPFLDRFRARLARIRLNRPTLPMIASQTGTWGTPEELATPEHWVRHLREPVRFGDGIAEVLATPGRILLEVGSGQGLAALSRMARGRHLPRAIATSTRSALDTEDDAAVLTIAAGQLWAHGASVDLGALRGPGNRRRVPLPTYAFERQRHWIDRPTADAQPRAHAVHPDAGRPSALLGIRRLGRRSDWFQAPVMRPEPLTGRARSTPRSHWLVFSDGSPLSAALVAELTARKISVVVVTPDASLAVAGDGPLRIDPALPEHYRELVDALDRRGTRIDGILHCWSVTGSTLPPGLRSQVMAFDSLLLLLQAIAHNGWDHPIRLQVVTSGAVPIDPRPDGVPVTATLLGPVRVWPRETPGATATLIDITADAWASADLAYAIIDEALLDTSATKVPPSLVALRGRQRLVERFEPAAASPTGPARIKRGGTYLVTGGLGGIGRLLARHLAETYDVRLALIGRRAAADLDASQRSSLARLARQAIWLQADVTDEGEMARAIAATREHFGGLDGVFHAAGTMDDAPLATKSLADAHTVLAPKVDGALVLHRLLPPGTIELFAVFSSTSAIIGPPGQIDYAAGNAFLDALAASRADGLAIDWGIWRDTGLAVRRSGCRDAMAADKAPVHPLLGLVNRRDGPLTRFEARYDAAALWPLAEHAVGTTPILPGTGYVEMARAALEVADSGQTFALHDIEFLSPLAVPYGTEQLVATEVRVTAPDTALIEVSSRAEATAPVTLHFRARASHAARPESLARLDVWRPGSAVASTDLVAQNGVVDFGPRWDCIRSLELGGGQARAALELDAEFAADLAEYLVHPALLDMAATIGLHLIPAAVRSQSLYVPAAIARLVVQGALPARIVSHARLVASEPGRSATFDVKLADPDGAVLMEIEGFELRAIPHDALAGADDDVRTPSAALSRLLAAGIRADDAPALFERILGASEPRLVVSSIALGGLDRLFTERSRAELPARPIGTDAANAAKPAAVAMTATEQAVAALFGELLGLDTVGPDDEFLALGGHSLAAVRLFARVRRQLGADFGIATLFEAPSVRRLAALVDERTGTAPTQARITEPAQSAPSRPTPVLRAPSRWSPLVKIAEGDPGRPPIYCIHGAMGNIVSIKPLADLLKAKYPIYGLQAQGVDGRLPPLEKIEDMAVKYLAAIREFDPEGPQCLLGYSGGGVVGYEMARQMELSGQRLDVLAMIDSLAPSHAKGTRLTDWLRHARTHGLAEVGDQLRIGLRERVNRLTHRSRAAVTDATTLDELLHNSARVFDAYINAQSRYVMRPYTGDVLLFRARASGIAFQVAGHTLGWGGHIGDNLTVHVLDADHASVIEQPAVRRIAEVLDERLERLRPVAQAAGSDTSGPASDHVQARDVLLPAK